MRNDRKQCHMKRQIGSFFYKPSTRAKHIRRKRWNLPRLIFKLFKRTATAIGAIVLFSIFTGIMLGMVIGGGGKTRALPKDMILVLNVENGLRESAGSSSLLDPFAGRTLTVHQLITTLEKAKQDKRVRGILVSLDSAGIELAHIQEIRTAIHDFRTSGKYAHIYTPSFADLGGGIGAYYFASAFDQIWMQPVGMVAITGVSMEMPFARTVLDKVGVKPEFLQREEYKSAMENFTHSEMSPENRESIQSIIADISAKMLGDITKDRQIHPQKMTELVDLGLLTGEEALKAGLINRIDYADKLVEEMRGGKTADELPLVSVEDYYNTIKRVRPTSTMKSVALVNISGQIVSGSRPEPGYATSDYLAEAIHEAADDENIKALIVRVDSPGGSPTASETIRRAIMYAKEKGKKIVVSMGPVAASGGYWVSVDADRIFALPSTLTGSIGVVMGKFQIEELWKKIGVNWDRVRWGEHSGMWSANRSFTESEFERMNTVIDATYQSFVDRVTKGRNMTPENVRDVAKGRAWTGTQAVEKGLVDEIGGLDSALDYAAQQLGEKDRHQLNIVPMPKPLSGMEQLMMLMGDQVGISQFLRTKASLLQPLEPWMKEYQANQRMGVFQTYDSATGQLKY
jgi:protease-4